MTALGFGDPRHRAVILRRFRRGATTAVLAVGAVFAPCRAVPGRPSHLRTSRIFLRGGRRRPECRAVVAIRGVRMFGRPGCALSWPSE